METLRISIIYLIGFITGVAVGKEFLSRPSRVGAEFGEYLLDDMEIFYVNGGKELIHDVAQVEVGENFVIMLDREKNVKAIIPNREIERIKSIRKDVE